jgi:hypothetical protein
MCCRLLVIDFIAANTPVHFSIQDRKSGVVQSGFFILWNRKNCFESSMKVSNLQLLFVALNWRTKRVAGNAEGRIKLNRYECANVGYCRGR